MKVSIITVCFNSQDTISDAIKSVLDQDYKNIEYIIIDGKSSDNTLSEIKKFPDKISRIVSEKDKGMYFALNKGIELSTGDIIGILHSDDFFENNHVISEVVRLFQDKDCEAIYGDIQYVSKSNPGKITRSWISGKYKHGLFLKGWMPPHPAFFVKKNIYEKFGLFNTSLKFAADYELMLRFIHKHKIKLSYLPKILVKMRVGGKSNKSIINRIKANIEDRKAWKLNGLRPGLFTLINKPFSKIFQFLRK
jgi:glycosyltransferase involved in cell wall biosynthesis